MAETDPWASVRHEVAQLSDCGWRLKFYVGAAAIARHEEGLLRKRASRLRLPGFRPGRVPLPLARQHFGDALRGEVFEEVGKAALGSVLRRLDPGRLLAPPELTPPPLDAVGDELEFVAQYELWPVVAAPDTVGLAVERCAAVVEDADVERQLQSLRRRQAQRLEVSRPPRDGDWVTLNYRLERESGEAVFSREGLELLFGATAEASRALPPELFAALAGSAPGAAGEFELRLAANHPTTALRGAALRGHYQLLKVCEPQLPELDDAFCAALGVTEGGVEALRVELRRSLQSAADAAARRRQRQQLFDALLERAETPEPPIQLLRGEIATMRAELVRRNGGPQAGPEDEALPDALFDEAARRRVRLGLVLGALVEKHALSVELAELRAAIEAQAGGSQQPEQLWRWYRDNPAALRGVEQSILEEKVVDKLLAEAVVTEREMPVAELLANVPNAPEAQS